MKKLFILAMCAIVNFAIYADNVVIPQASVVKIFAVKNKPNYYRPWANYPATNGTGSGVIISGNRILTNAHVIADHSFITVRKRGNAKKFIAKVVIMGPECDLAILDVVDKDFFEGMKALEIGDLPKSQETVRVLGFPMGGNNVSITEGVVSRIEPSQYTLSNRTLLTVQIDAAINPGNSGGPVIMDNKIVGIAFQSRNSGENMGFMIPAPVVKHFLKDIKDNKFDGFPDIDINISQMENPAMRESLGMTKEQTGVLITDLSLAEQNLEILKKHDVILEINGVKIANDMTIPFRDDEVIIFANDIWNKEIGDIIKFTLLRDKKIITRDYTLGNPKYLVSTRKFNSLPSYYIYGGFVFVPLTQNYLDSWGNWWKNAPKDLVHHKRKSKISKDREEIVVLSSVLADDMNIGYQNYGYNIVTKANDIKVKSLKHFVEIVDNCDTKYIKITLEDDDIIVLNTEKAKQSNANILKRYKIPNDRSNDLKSKKFLGIF